MFAKIKSLSATFHESEIIQIALFNSCIEYKSSAHFIQNDLIPIIIDYEVTDNDLLSEIGRIYQQNIHTHAMQTKTSVFTLFGWIELCLFLFLNVANASNMDLLHQLKSYVAPTLFILFGIHLWLAIRIFNERRIFCCYFQCLSSVVDDNAYKYIPFLLEGFNLFNISLFHSHSQRVKLINPNNIKTSNVLIFSLKYILFFDFSFFIVIIIGCW